MSEEVKKRVLKVKSNTNVQSLAGCITNCRQKGEEIELHAIGAGAVNQMLKAIIVSQSHLAMNGKYLAIIAGFDTVQEQNGERTVIVARLRELL